MAEQEPQSRENDPKLSKVSLRKLLSDKTRHLGEIFDQLTTPDDSPPDGPLLSRATLTRDPARRVAHEVGTAFDHITQEPLEPTNDGPPITRREMTEEVARSAIPIVEPILDLPLGVLADLLEHMSPLEFNRRKLLIRTAGIATVITLAGVGRFLSDLYQEDPHIFEQSEAAAKLLPVWQELQNLGRDYTNEELVAMTHNPFKDIVLTAEEAANLLFVGDGDSIYLYKGIRVNSEGVKQPKCWFTFAQQKINDGLALLGIKGNVKYANYAQPGANSKETVGRQNFGSGQSGNVQLGARTTAEMIADSGKPDELPPYDLMINHKGTLIAAYGIHGDDMRDTAALAIEYLDPKSAKYDAEFTAFVKKPSKEALTSHIADVLLTLIDSYKKDRERIKENFAKALTIYREINQKRIAAGMGKMYLVVTQPMRLDEAKNAPYTPVNAERGTQGTIHLDQYGAGGKLAGRMVMLPFYQEETPLLQAFEEQTRQDGSEIQVTSVPLLALSGQDSLVIWDGHYNEQGEQEIWSEVAKALKVIAPQQQSSLSFQTAGEPQLIAA